MVDRGITKNLVKIWGLKGLNNMKQGYIFEYQNENDFRKKERSVRKYNMLAYKKLTFEYYPSIRNGEFLGELVSQDKNTKSYDISMRVEDILKERDSELRRGIRNSEIIVRKADTEKMVAMDEVNLV